MVAPRACGEGDRARLPDRRGRARRDRRRRGPAAAGAPQPAHERRQVHRGGRGRRASSRPRPPPTGSYGLELAVRDTGIGIPQDRMDRLFDVVQPGRRLDDAALRRHRARPRDLEAAGRADGRDDVGGERGRAWARRSTSRSTVEEAELPARPRGRRRRAALDGQAPARRRRQRDEPRDRQPAGASVGHAADGGRARRRGARSDRGGRAVRRRRARHADAGDGRRRARARDPRVPRARAAARARSRRSAPAARRASRRVRGAARRSRSSRPSSTTRS